MPQVFYDPVDINKIVAHYSGDTGAAWAAMTKLADPLGSFTGIVDIRHHKIVGSTITEMTSGEKTARPLPSVEILPSQSLFLLSSASPSGSSQVDFEDAGYFLSTYRSLLLIASNLTPSIDDTRLSIRYKLGGAYKTVGYSWRIETRNSSGLTIWNDADDVSIPILASPATLGTGTREGMNFNLWIRDPANAVMAVGSISYAWGKGADGVRGSRTDCGGGHDTIGPLQGIRIFPSAGNFSGKLDLYGLKGS